MDSTFKKAERLKSNLAIKGLLDQGKTLSSFPLKIFWNSVEDPGQKFPVKVAILVPKKRFPRAVDRNLMKRRIRESYRQNKQPLYESLNKSDLKLLIVIMLLSDEIMTFSKVESSLKDLLIKLSKNI